MEIGKLSDHFSRSEFACKCGCGFDTVDVELIMVLEDLHDHFSGIYDNTKVRIIIKSGCRCVEHNEAVQKEGNPSYIPYSSKSIHMTAKAADIVVQVHVLYQGWVDVPSDSIAGYLENKYPDRYGIGRYNGRTHFDVRSTKARWDYR